MLLNKLNEWCKKWLIKVNESKSKIIHFRTKLNRVTDVNFCFDGNILEIVSEYKYLGVLIDEHLSFEKATAMLAEAGGRALGSIISKFKKMKDCSFRTFEKLYESGVVPVATYGAAIWGFKDYKCLNDLQNRAIRYYLGVHKYAPILGLQGETAWTPPKLRHHKCILSYWNRMIGMSDNRLTKTIFNWDYNKKRSNWCSGIQNIFSQCNKSYIFDGKQYCSVIEITKMIMDRYKLQWFHDIEHKPKLRSYRLFKCNFQTEKYLYLNLPKWKRSILAQFRLGILPLNIETGRYKIVKDKEGCLRRQKPEERLCTLCTLGSTEDEIHFLLDCPCYDSIRKDLLTMVLIKNENFLSLSKLTQFKYLMENCVKLVSNYLFSAWDRRKNLLYSNSP